ncbi:HAMP domain-containing sensor histidine kinase [Streptomyces sp. P9(2023)]|uniref:sensor histidine kinase n=1 Tax=Streptomyces sp. P9(2023) TaxID=3064394 RepID=UPI0028F4235C|nr:HAMP domain-containing sensor histidine kinase [Streptomyces sp. P9(2023)]MDT9687131.1 HAMP domain-containing sensor histidine kinase [Streptomyces sp. P9(2023)]
MNIPAARALTPTERVRRLRRRITALFALTSAAGLVAMAVLAVRSDDARWREQLDQAMNLDTTQAISLLTYDEDDRLDTADLAGTMDTGCPQLTVFSVPRDGSSGPVVDYAGKDPCLAGRPADVRAVAGTALRREDVVAVDGRAVDGRPVRLFAEPFFAPDAEGDAGRDGAVVTLYETSEAMADHRRTTWLLAAGCAVLVLLSAAVGHVLSGRAIRPALTALGQQEAFLADAAHDLRTPVASLRMLAETALRGDTDSTEVLRRTMRLADGMGGLVDGLLTRARLMTGVQTLAREPLRLDQLVEAVVADTPAEGHRVTVRAGETVVVADPDLVRRAVANLLGNALAHGHAPGEAADVMIEVAREGREGIVTVTDGGPGLPPGVADALFERFRSGAGSTGLGLSIASWVAHAHGGSLTATSGGGSGGGETGELRGARFVLRLPADES